jgi:hypothetical protein
MRRRGFTVPSTERHLDLGSQLVVIVTFLLFVAALFFKGLSHDLLLEAGVFLVSVKLIIMAYTNSVAEKQLHDRFDGLQITLTRIERLLASGSAAVNPPKEEPPRG